MLDSARETSGAIGNRENKESEVGNGSERSHLCYSSVYQSYSIPS